MNQAARAEPIGGAPPAASTKKMRLGDMLVLNKQISEVQLNEALTEQKKTGHKLGHTLIEMGFIDEPHLLRFLSQQLRIPYIDLTSYKLNVATVKKLPETLARRFRALVLEYEDDVAVVGMADPTNIYAFDEISRHLKRRVRQTVVRESDLLVCIDEVYRRTEEIANLAEELEASESSASGGADETRLVAAADRVFASMACHSARRFGDRLPPEEQQAILAGLDQIPWAPTCPHGRPVAIALDRAEIEQRFRRR